MPATHREPTLLLSFDLEDWEQLNARHVGHPGWDRPWSAFERQVRRIFDLLDDLRARATFFLLGVTIKNYPDVAREIVRRGDEIACHGFGHQVVYAQDAVSFRRDIERAVEVIEAIAGRRPRGYRAPLFSITRETLWAYDVLADLGFTYDASQNDSPRLPRRLGAIPDGPYRLRLASNRELFEFPLAMSRVGPWSLPIGGGGYWRLLPDVALRRLLRRSGDRGGVLSLYFHPFECDAGPLRVPLPPASSSRMRARAAWKNLRAIPGRRGLVERLAGVARSYRLLTHAGALEELGGDPFVPTRSLSPAGVLVGAARP
jgi:polysaccharide deacetylase family protein (PEP-CTERM system associated)